MISPYQDHVGLWENELKAWLPERIFDAHVHLTPPDLIGRFSAARVKEPLCTFGGFTWEELTAFYTRLFSAKRIVGLIAFPLPMRETHLDAANDYIIELMRRDSRIKGFLLPHPTDVSRIRRTFERARSNGVRFHGVKPYFDLLGKSNYETTMSEFIPEGLLEFMQAEELVMMLHTSGRGMGVRENQIYIRSVLERYPSIRIVLAHMGRYLNVEEFFRFCDSGLLEYPNLFLEMSSASRREVYERVLANRSVHDRLVFGTDLPFGMITGVEAWSEKTGPVFITRDRYPWSDECAESVFAHEKSRLTYNTYHVIKAFKDALGTVLPEAGSADVVKEKVFHRNALSLFTPR